MVGTPSRGAARGAIRSRVPPLRLCLEAFPRWNRLYVYVLKLPKSSPRGSGEPAAPRRTAEENGPGELVRYRRPPPRRESILNSFIRRRLLRV